MIFCPVIALGVKSSVLLTRKPTLLISLFLRTPSAAKAPAGTEPKTCMKSAL